MKFKILTFNWHEPYICLLAKLDHEFIVNHQLLRIPDSTRLFHDPISRELMVSASVDWLAKHLSSKKSNANSCDSLSHHAESDENSDDAASLHKSE